MVSAVAVGGGDVAVAAVAVGLVLPPPFVRLAQRRLQLPLVVVAAWQSLLTWRLKLRGRWPASAALLILRARWVEWTAWPFQRARPALCMRTTKK